MRSLWLVVLLMAVALSHGQSPARVTIGDKLRIDVIGNTEYTGAFTVVSDGSISGRGFGRIVVVGHTLDDVATIVRKRLKAYVKNPDVFASFDSQLPQMVFVVGMTPATGPVNLGPGTTVRTLLASGNLPERPDRLDASVIRGGKVFKVLDIPALLHGEPAWDGPLERNDVLLIQPKPTIRVWLLGPFRNPGERTFDKGASLAQALGEVESVAPGAGQSKLDEAAWGKAKVILRRGDHETTLAYSPGSQEANDLILESGDTVSVVTPKVISVVVAGLVQHPGEQGAWEGASLYGAIAQAGGVLPEGTLRRVLLFRRGESFEYDLSPALDGKPENSPHIEADDIVYVSESKAMVQVLGEVAKPGRVFLQDGHPMRVSEALAVVGGLGPNGTLRRVALLRPDSKGKLTPRYLNLDEFLRDGKQDANPWLQAGDVIMFDHPRGITLGSASQTIATALLLRSLSK